MSGSMARRQFPEVERGQLWEPAESGSDSDLRNSLRGLSQAIARAERDHSIGGVKAALIALAGGCHHSGYRALACLCLDMLERIEDAEAAAIAKRIPWGTFRCWLQHVEDYLGSPLYRQGVSALINTQRQLWSYPPLSRSDRVLLVRALRCGGR